MKASGLATALVALLSAILLGLAAGAVWMLPVFYLGRPLPWLALPVGWLLGRAIRAWVYPPGLCAALLAALASLLAALYVNMLVAGAMIAGDLGLGFVEALRGAGPAMLASLARLRLSSAQAGIAVLGIALAYFTARRGRAAPAKARDPGRP